MGVYVTVIVGFPVYFCHHTAPQKSSFTISLGSIVPFCYPCQACNMTCPPPAGFCPHPSLCFHSVIHNHSIFYAPSFSTSLNLILGTEVPPLWAAVREQQETHIWPLLNLSHIDCLTSLFGMLERSTSRSTLRAELLSILPFATVSEIL